MTRKDYQLIAEALRKARPIEQGDEVSRAVARAQHRVAVSYITGALAGDNPRFDEGKFLDAVYGADARNQAGAPANY